MTSINEQHAVTEDDVWEFTDLNDADEDRVRWHVGKLYVDGTADLVKLTGRHPGYVAKRYDVSKFAEPEWSWVEGHGASRVTFNCPVCERAEPIPMGDYVCSGCRQSLDNTPTPT